MSYFYHYLTTCEVHDSLKDKKLLLPVGTIEQHGPHLPLSVDVDIPQAIAIKLTEKMNALVAPAICYGARSLPQSGGGASFPGTISVNAGSLIGYYRDIIQSYINNGTRELIIINGHYENEPFLFEALEQCREHGSLNAKVIAFSWWSLITEELIIQLFGNTFPGWHAEHAGAVETSLMMFLYPERVRPIRVDHNAPPMAGVYIHPIDAQVISNQGCLSSTSSASTEIVEKLFVHICDQIIFLINHPHGMKQHAIS